MRPLKPEGIKINIDEKDRKLLFTLNVIDELQEYYDMGILEIMNELYGDSEEQKRNSYRMMRKILTVLLNEDVEINNETSDEKWEKIDEKYVGRRITKENTYDYARTLLTAYTGSVPKTNKDDDDDDDGEEEKNLESVNTQK